MCLEKNCLYRIAFNFRAEKKVVDRKAKKDFSESISRTSILRKGRGTSACYVTKYQRDKSFKMVCFQTNLGKRKGIVG